MKDEVARRCSDAGRGGSLRFILHASSFILRNHTLAASFAHFLYCNRGVITCWS
jgi:hypothetical protein